MITFVLIAVTVLVSWQAFEKRRLYERLVLWPPGVQRFRQYDRLLTHGFVHADSGYVSLGASGAVSAVLFAFVLVDPWNWIIVFVIPVPAVVYAIAYVGYSYWMDKRGGDNINHSAHLSGAIYGLLFMLLMEPRVGLLFLERLASPRGPGFFG